MGGRLAKKWLRSRLNLSLAILLAVSGMFPVMQTVGVRFASAADSDTTLYVTVTGGVYTQDGLSWETALPGDQLQDAISGADPGTQIWVAAGTYYPTEDAWGNTEPADLRSKTFRLRNNISVYGGFAGTESSPDERNLEENATVLSGNLGDPNSNADNAYHVFYHPNGSNLNETAVLDGVTITGGKADGSAAINQSGGGMYGDNVSPTLRNVTFTGNEAVDEGGGLYAIGSAPTLTNVAFRNNTAGSKGGGLYTSVYTDFSILDAEFSGNSAASGGGFRLDQGTADLENVTFENNEAGTGGGAGISVNGNTTTLNLTGATLIGNTSAGQGGGIRSYNATLNLADVTISGNTGTAGGGIYSTDGKLELTDATIEDNTASADAGGIYSAYNGVRMTNVAFRGNQAGGDGGGLYLSDVEYPWLQVVLTNMLFSGNTADSRGGGLFLADIYDIDPFLTNVTMAGNVASQGGGLYIGSSDYVHIRNSIIWGNTAESDANVYNSYGARYSHSLIEGSGGSGEGWVAAFGADQGGNLDDDPRFADHVPAQGNPTTAGDYRLTEDSPAIDAGDGDVFAAGATPDLSGVTTDLAGGDRVVSGIVDMGAYEWSPMEPSIIHVTVDGSGAQNGSSWDNAYPGTKLQDAINGAVKGSEIRVAAGTYYPTKEAGGAGDRFRAFQLKNGVAIYGGFPANPSPDTGMDDRDWTSNPTILSGDLDVQGSNSDNAYHVIHIPADMTLDDTAVLDGFTITGGNANGMGQAGKGGGILMESGSPTLRNLLIEGNEASYGGGGLYLENSSPSLEQVTFKRNKAQIVGGGAYVGQNGQLYLSDGAFEDNESQDSGGGLGVLGNGAVAELKNVTISGNKAAGEGGGGIYSKATLKLEDATIKDNTNTKPSGSFGGGVFQTGGALMMTRVTLEGNTASQGGALALYINGTATLNDVKANRNTAGINGGGIVVFGAVTLTATNVTVAGNEAESGGGLYVGSTLSVTLTNVLVSGNKAANTGGGLFVQNGKPVLTNVTINGNAAAGEGGGLVAKGGGGASVRNGIIWGNSAPEYANVKKGTGLLDFSHSLVQGSGGSDDWDDAYGEDLDGNLDADPEFLDPVQANEAPTADGDYRLKDTSPAVDAGDTSLFSAGKVPDLSGVTTDLAGDERVRYLTVDMGAYELLDEAAPSITSFTPEDGEEDVEPDTELKLVFNEPIRPVMGKMIQIRTSDDELAASVNAALTTWQNAEVTITLPSDLQYGTDYYVTIEEGAFVDRALNPLPAITGKTDWTFSTVEADKLVVTATGYNRQIMVSWNAVSGADSYEIYRRASDQSYGAPITDWTETEATFAGLTNGITYYIKVRAMKSGMAIAESDEVSATPMTVPGAPTGVTAVAGDGQATVSFTAPADNGGGAITEYVVTATPGGKTATGTSSPITVTGLTNGTSYTFTVQAVNKAGTGEASAESNAVTPQGSSGGEPGNEEPGEEEPGEEEPGNGNPGPSQPANPAPETPATGNTGVDVLVNGKAESAGTMTTGTRNGQTVTTVTLDENRLEERLAEEGRGTVVTIPVNTGTEVVVGELNGQMVKSMEASEAVVEIRTDRASYTLPARQINIDALSGQIGAEVELRDIKVQIEIAEPAADTVRVVESAAADGSFELVVPPLEFTVRAVHENTVIEVAKFTAYVERMVAIPDGADPEKITTAVVVEPDGTVRHVPTKVELIDGRYYARVNSLTNSTYTVIWHPVAFADMADHWAKDAVNDMGSRMVIEGVGGGRFEPGREVTRAEFAAILVRALGLKLEEGAAPFTDVRESDWHNGAVLTAHAYGLIAGYGDGAFRPDERITREQAMTMLARAMALTNLKASLPGGSADEALRPYADAAETSGWALAGIADSVQAGIVTGRGGEALAPKAFITRAEAAVMVERLLRRSGLI